MEEKKKEIKYFDYGLLTVLIFLICFGLVVLYSTSYYSAQIKFDDGKFYLMKQIKAYVLSFIIMFMVSKFDYRRYYKNAEIVYWMSLALLFFVLIPGVGIDAYGAKRWIKIPFLGQMQPSELVKISIILFIPVKICECGNKIKNIKDAAKVLAYAALASVLIWKVTDNLSTALIVGAIAFFMIILSMPDVKWKKRLLIGIVASIGIIYIIKAVMVNHMTAPVFHDDFRARRILVWLNPKMYISQGGYQVMQGLYAIGSGGFWGKGLGNSVQKLMIPEAQNDMILPIIGEELGIFGIIVVFVLFGFLLYRLLFIAQNAPDKYSALIVTGIFLHIALQVILNVCVVLNVIPTTGITLPFISYGGTASVFLMVEMGIALGISTKIKIQK